MTFSEYIIQERSKVFYFISLEQMSKCKTTLEDWFHDMYYDYKMIYGCTPENCRNGFKEKEQWAVYEKEPAHGKDKNGVILAPYNTEEEAKDAGIRYGYSGDNYYIDKLIYEKSKN